MTQSNNPRSIALRVLEDLERREAYADVVLDAALNRAVQLPVRDRALVSHLVYGVLRWRNRLDAHLAVASNRPLKKLQPTLLQILRLGAYQLLFLDRIPARAAVNEAVELARARGAAHAAGFVNAVLRRVSEQDPEPPHRDDPGAHLSLLFGCPEWLVERWTREQGETGARALCQGAAAIPATWLRVERRRIRRDDALAELERHGIEAVPGAFAPDAIRIQGQGDLRRNPLVEGGLAVVQDQASQLVALAANPGEGARVLDACAAPGLKATHLAALAGAGGRVLALDLHPHRAAAIARLAARLGVDNLYSVAADALTPPTVGAWDLVLVDAPCSGLGVLSRTPEAKWRRTPESIAGLPTIQRGLLEQLAPRVRQGGALVYATCTTVRAENEEVVEGFLADHPGFELVPPEAPGVPWDDLLTGPGYLCTYPRHADAEGAEALDGFFAARLRRRSN